MKHRIHKTKKKSVAVRRKSAIWATLLAAVALAFVLGCAGKKQAVNTEAPAASAPVVTEETPAPETQAPPEKYPVRKGDCLWSISGNPEIYGDSFLWPLLFKANRDLIQDPDLIYPGQKLTVDKSASDMEIKEAKKLAADTPKYVPHAKARKKLPVDYF